MKIAEFVTSEYAYPITDGTVFAPLDVVANLTEGWVKAGHDVAWYAPEGTKTNAQLVSLSNTPVQQSPTWQAKNQAGQLIYSIFMDSVFLSHLAKDSSRYDVIHLNSLRLALPFARLIDKPVVITLHDPLSTDSAKDYLRQHSDLKNVHFISISDNQREPMPDLPYASTIHHGLTLQDHPWSESAGQKWIYTGRIVPEKGVAIAAKLIKEAGEQLDIYGPVYQSDKKSSEYFENEIKPLVDGEQIRYMGAVARDHLVKDIYPQAKGFIFPLQWEEPFGLTVIEAMAAGVPVVTFPRGSMKEIIEHGKTGYLVQDEAQMLEAIKSIGSINRKDCREHAERSFSSDRVVADYLRVFEQLVG